MEYLLAHADDGPLPVDVATPNAPDKTDEDPAKSAQSSSAGTEPEEAKEAKSIKCGDCGRLFKTQLEVEFHATKSGHSNFEESTEEKAPLTEEQKKAQMALLEEKMRLKRIEREQKEKVKYNHPCAYFFHRFMLQIFVSIFSKKHLNVSD